MPPLPAGALITTVLVVIVLELLVLATLAALGRQRALVRQMWAGAGAGLFLTLALRELHAGGLWLPLWLACAGAAHAMDWWQRARR